MTAVSYSLIENEEGRDVLTIFIEGDIFTITSNHDNYVTTLEEVRKDAPNAVLVRQLVNIEESLNEFLADVVSTGRVTVSRGEVCFDGKLMDGSLTNHLLKLYSAGDVYGVIALSKFLENAMENPGGEESVESLWSWMRGRNFTITDDGCFVAYKGVRTLGDGTMVSVHSGTASVNGVVHKNQQIPNKIGAVITMDRSDVNADRSHGCSHGLHAGTWEYAKSFAPTTLAVKIDPRDVVSVPGDHAFAKLRVSKYVVMSRAQRRFEEDEDESKRKALADASW